MNLGALALQKALRERTGANQVGFAKELKIDQGNLSKLLTGKKRPGLKTRRRLFEKLGIDVLDWDRRAAKAAPANEAPPATQGAQ